MCINFACKCLNDFLSREYNNYSIIFIKSILKSEKNKDPNNIRYKAYFAIY